MPSITRISPLPSSALAIACAAARPKPALSPATFTSCTGLSRPRSTVTRKMPCFLAASQTLVSGPGSCGSTTSAFTLRTIRFSILLTCSAASRAVEITISRSGFAASRRFFASSALHTMPPVQPWSAAGIDTPTRSFFASDFPQEASPSSSAPAANNVNSFFITNPFVYIESIRR